MKKFWGTAKVVFGRFLLTAILIAPIAVYVSKFGFTISSDHGRWSEMGSAMSGIYGSILAWLAFGVLILQARMQNESNKHMSDQSYVQNAREDVDFYLGRLEEILDKPNFNGQTPRHVLNTEFAFADIEQLSGNNLKQLANSLNLHQPHLQSIWSALYSIFEGLRCNEEEPYALQFSSAKQKSYVILSYVTCVALDNYIHCASEGRLRYHYNFSRILSAP